MSDLDAEFARRCEDESLDVRVAGIHVVQKRQPERGGLSGAGLGLADHVAAFKQGRNRLLLNRGRGFVADFGQGLKKFGPKAKFGESRHLHPA